MRGLPFLVLLSKCHSTVFLQKATPLKNRQIHYLLFLKKHDETPTFSHRAFMRELRVGADPPAALHRPNVDEANTHLHRKLLTRGRTVQE